MWHFHRYASTMFLLGDETTSRNFSSWRICYSVQHFSDLYLGVLYKTYFIFVLPLKAAVIFACVIHHTGNEEPVYHLSCRLEVLRYVTKCWWYWCFYLKKIWKAILLTPAWFINTSKYCANPFRTDSVNPVSRGLAANLSLYVLLPSKLLTTLKNSSVSTSYNSSSLNSLSSPVM